MVISLFAAGPAGPSLIGYNLMILDDSWNIKAPLGRHFFFGTSFVSCAASGPAFSLSLPHNWQAQKLMEAAAASEAMRSAQLETSSIAAVAHGGSSPTSPTSFPSPAPPRISKEMCLGSSEEQTRVVSFPVTGPRWSVPKREPEVRWDDRGGGCHVPSGLVIPNLSRYDEVGVGFVPFLLSDPMLGRGLKIWDGKQLRSPCFERR